MSDPQSSTDRYRAALEVLSQARSSMLETLVDTILDSSEEFAEGGFRFNEFLEVHGTRLHFLILLISQLEMLNDSEETALEEEPLEAEADEEPTLSEPVDSSEASNPKQDDDPPQSSCEESTEPGH